MRHAQASRVAKHIGAADATSPFVHPAADARSHKLSNRSERMAASAPPSDMEWCIMGTAKAKRE